MITHETAQDITQERVLKLLSEQIFDPDTQWSLGTFGDIAIRPKAPFLTEALFYLLDLKQAVRAHGSVISRWGIGFDPAEYLRQPLVGDRVSQPFARFPVFDHDDRHRAVRGLVRRDLQGALTRTRLRGDHYAIRDARAWRLCAAIISDC